MNIVGKSDIGLVRSINQDNFLIAHNKHGNILAIVCDGIGGSVAGEVASLLAVKSLGKAFSESEHLSTSASAKLWLENNIKIVNDEVYISSIDNSEYSGMGTTMVAALIVNKEVVIANIGDSRAYVSLNNKLFQITVDHSLLNDLVSSGKLNEDELASHPQQNILTNAIGISSNLKIDSFLVNRGEKLLLCSDGLSSFTKEETILQILNRNDVSNMEKVDLLINEANFAGGFDNITVVIIDMEEF